MSVPRVRVLEDAERRIGSDRTTGALDLARRLPRLAIEARRIATAVAHGIHGRRRPGSGESFWQFRPFTTGEPAHRIDWRRSGRDDHLYVREREWEASHSVRIWIDRSPSMAFVSSLALAPKLDRAVVLGLALADLLVRGGERVGLLGSGPTMASRAIVERLAEALAGDPRGTSDELPEALPLPALSEAVLLTDAISPAEEIAAVIESLAARGARGHVVRIVDPVEESFPFEGQTELLGTEGATRLEVGDAGAFRAAYRARMEVHGVALAEACGRRGWSLLVHRTDRPASEALLALATRVARARGGPM
jgi:uncharacterized protein (DUF58 family)